MKKKYEFSGYVDLDKEVFLDKKGVRITDARARAIAKEMHAQVLGRPSLTGKAAHSPEIKARVPEKLKEKLQKEAERQGRTTSELIRQALEFYLANPKSSVKRR